MSSPWNCAAPVADQPSRELEAALLLRGSRKVAVFEPAYQGEFNEVDQPPER